MKFKLVFGLPSLVTATVLSGCAHDQGATSESRQTPVVVEGRPGYNCWPMIQAMGSRLVCAYSIGVRHSIGDGEFGVYVRTSDDAGKTWSEPVELVNDPNVGEQAEGSGLDEQGAMLLWVRFCGSGAHHDLYRTLDGKAFERIAQPKLNPLPTQVTNVLRVPGVGLMSLWFYCTYGGGADRNCWGTLVSADNGRTWTQRTVESGLPIAEAANEPSVIRLDDRRLLAIARCEGTRQQFQLTSLDSGETWTKRKTNITDVAASTPSLVYSPDTGLVANDYYQRGAGLLKRRTCSAKEIFDRPTAWPEPELVAVGGKIPPDAGNSLATRLGDRDYVAYYSGAHPNTKVLVVSTDAR